MVGATAECEQIKRVVRSQTAAGGVAVLSAARGTKKKERRKKEKKKKINRDSELEKDKLACPRGRLDRHANSWSAEVALVCRVGKMEKLGSGAINGLMEVQSLSGRGRF